MNNFNGVKRSRRHIKISKRLADSLIQEETFSKTLEVETPIPVKPKPPRLLNQSEYTLAQLKLLDGSLLFKYFSSREILPTGLTKYKCQLLRDDKSCIKNFVKRNERDCKALLTKHLIEHIKTIEIKNAKYPKLYGKKRFYPYWYVRSCKKKKQGSNKKETFSKPTQAPIKQVTKTVEDKSQLAEKEAQEKTYSRQKLYKISSYQPKKDEFITSVNRILQKAAKNNNFIASKNNYLGFDYDRVTNIVDFENQTIMNSKEALLSAVSLVRVVPNKNVDVNKKINTRGNRKKVIESRNSNLEKEKQETWRKYFAKQPSVLISDFSNQGVSKEDLPVDHTENTFQMQLADSIADFKDYIDDVNSSSSSAVLFPQKEGKNTNKLVKELPNKTKYVPNILRRKKKCINPEKKIDNKVTCEKNDNSSPVPLDITSDCSLECSEVINEEIIENLTYKSPRKQILGNVPNAQELDFAFSCLKHDHDYSSVTETTTSKNNDSKFVKLLPKQGESLQLSTSNAPELEKRGLNIKPKSGGQKVFDLGKYSRIEPATDQKTKNLALKLINELKHRKPKEVMVCTEKNIEGQSSYIVQDFFTCEICGKNFTAPNSLYGHYRGHAGIKPFRCKVCGKTFTRSHSLNYHSMIHEGSARFECQFCFRKFRHPTHYKEHLFRHTGEEPYRCLECPRRFKTRNSYRRHMTKKHNKRVTVQGSIPKNARYISSNGTNRRFLL